MKRLFTCSTKEKADLMLYALKEAEKVLPEHARLALPNSSSHDPNTQGWYVHVYCPLRVREAGFKKRLVTYTAIVTAIRSAQLI